MRSTGSVPADRHARLRVGLLVGSLANGGAERVACRLAAEWASTGHRVTLLTWEARERDVYEVPAGVARVAIGDVRHARRLGALASLVKLRAWISEARPDILVCFLATNNLLGIAATLGSDIPVVVSERTAIDYYDAPWERLAQQLYRFADTLVVQTCSAATRCRVPVPIEVIPNPVSSARAVAVVPRQPLIVGIGRLVPEKRFDLLIDGFAALATRYPGWRLTVLGEGPLRPQLEARVQQHGLQDRIDFPGFVQDVDAWLTRAEVFALTSDVEGFPNALVEAMAAGCAVVATRCRNGPEEIIQNGVTGRLVPVGDKVALTSALDTYLTDPHHRQRVGKAAQDDVHERYATPRVSALWISLFRRLVTKPRSTT